jgi:P-type E1-E2 ATPase
MGQVEFIFSDKTGTLTCNIMEFKQVSVNNKIYSNMKASRDVFEQYKVKNNKVEYKACHEFYKVLAVCHTVVLDEDKETGEMKMQASSPDELALV